MIYLYDVKIKEENVYGNSIFSFSTLAPIIQINIFIVLG